MALFNTHSTASDKTCSRALIFGSGQYYSEMPFIPTNALVIAADGGYDYVNALGVAPHAFIGDMDSVTEFPSDAHIEEVIRLPREKDDTDMMAAVRYVWNKGIREFEFFGGLGGRLDHTLANIQIAAKIAHHGGAAFLHGDHTITTVIENSVMTFPAGYVAPSRPLSIFAHSSQCEHVTVEGLKYTVDDVQWTNTDVTGISNEFLPDTAATIAVSGGSLIVIYPSEAPTPSVEFLDEVHMELAPLENITTAQSKNLAHLSIETPTTTPRRGKHAA